MMRIDSLAVQPDRAGRHTVRFSDGRTMRLYRQTVEDFGLYVGLELDEQTYASLEKAAGLMSAKMRSVRIVAASSVSRRDLQHRLVQKGEDPEQAAQAVAWMEQLELIDDRKTAQQIVSRCISKGYGLARAKQSLYEKKIPKEFWEEVLADYPDQMDAIMDYLQNHITDPRDQKQVRKATDALIRKGHSYATVRRGLSQLDFDVDSLEEF